VPTDADLDALLAQLPADGSTIGNGFLREALGWDEARYRGQRLSHPEQLRRLCYQPAGHALGRRLA
jgi:hypothetical protein